MIQEKIGDIFKSEANVIIHQCNCFHTMKGGIAKKIAENYPEADSADKKSFKGINKLGSFTWAIVPDAGSEKIIFNMYSQGNYGKGKRYTSYDAMEKALTKIRIFIESQILDSNRDDDDYIEFAGSEAVKVGIPYQMGCGLGGGNWPIVKEIINQVFDDCKFEIAIYKLPELVQNSDDEPILI